ncbi:hypothetical protein PoB_003574500 [Plakobranchus ocellatus]|uniref:Uncharacterized protein n=1 Tax=Plakobranchus ocellatus TaxID=259542 RepID=A0AAV4AQU0_9GAST|nr:hypothetical protein PoB_003574500 [Plakobranchus ocellatus]
MYGSFDHGAEIMTGWGVSLACMRLWPGHHASPVTRTNGLTSRERAYQDNELLVRDSRKRQALEPRRSISRACECDSLVHPFTPRGDAVVSSSVPVTPRPGKILDRWSPSPQGHTWYTTNFLVVNFTNCLCDLALPGSEQSRGLTTGLGIDYLRINRKL